MSLRTRHNNKDADVADRQLTTKQWWLRTILYVVVAICINHFVFMPIVRRLVGLGTIDTSQWQYR
jgi:hypothetical protein